MRQSTTAALVTALAGSLLLSSCATYTGQTNAPDDPNRTGRGALIGAGIGAVAGLLGGGDATERRQRALVGAGVGGLAGGAVGAYQDRQEADLRRQMQGTGVDVVRNGDNITLNMPGNVTFATNSADLNASFFDVLNSVAMVANEFEQTVIEVAGHTDNTGSDQYNQQLSERRANAVAAYLRTRNVRDDRLITVGEGEARPIASNDTVDGRQQNRRVEITFVPLTAS